MTSLSLLQNSFILRRPRVANLADIIKIAFMFIIAIFKDSKTLKESEIMYYNASYICSFWYNKSCWFSVKKCWYQQNLTVVSRNWYIFWIFFMQGINVLSVIIVGYVWQLLWKVRFFSPPRLHPWAIWKRPILKRVKRYTKFSNASMLLFFISILALKLLFKFLVGYAPTDEDFNSFFIPDSFSLFLSGIK